MGVTTSTRVASVSAMAGRLKSDRRTMNASKSINKDFSMVIIKCCNRAVTVARLTVFAREMGDTGR